MRIATYNVWNEAASWAGRLGALCEELVGVNADIVALQEVPTRVSENDGRDAAAFFAEYAAYPYFVFRAYPGDEGEGLGLLSKFPLSLVECGWESGHAALGNCGLRARAELGGVPIALTNVHMDWQSVATREAQAIALSDWIESRAISGVHEFLCGDFNSDPDSSVHRFLAGQQTLSGRASAGWHDVASIYAYRNGQTPAPATLDFAGNPRWQKERLLPLPLRVDWILLRDDWPVPCLDVCHVSQFGQIPTPRRASSPATITVFTRIWKSEPLPQYDFRRGDMGYTIWIEFEHYADPPMEEPDGFCNIAVTYDDGRHQGYNVWTIDFFRENIPFILDDANEQGFSMLPDFIVSRLTREHITHVVKQILSLGGG